jgi:hypothetical protein
MIATGVDGDMMLLLVLGQLEYEHRRGAMLRAKIRKGALCEAAQRAPTRSFVFRSFCLGCGHDAILPVSSTLGAHSRRTAIKHWLAALQRWRPRNRAADQIP